MDDWTGTWELDRRENWHAYLEFLGVPPQALEAAEKAADFHKYRFSWDAFTMDHQIPAQSLHLHFRADIDGEWRDSPYPRPTVANWAETGDQEVKMPIWKNCWLEEPVKLKTEIPDFMGKIGKTLHLERELISNSAIKMTINVREEESVLVGPCYTWMKKTSDVGPEPISWLRANGKSLRSAEERKEVLQKMHQLVSENIDAISAAHEADRVFPSRFNGVAMMLMHGIKGYQDIVDGYMKPEVLEDACPPPLKAGVEAEYTVLNEPKGVCINISPWNAPVQLSLMPVMAMLASGNHAVIKTPDLVPTVSALLRRLVQKYLHGYVWVEEGGREAVERLIAEGADHLIFTGGGEIAKSVAALCAQQLTPVTLELGGKSPVFIDRGLSDEMLDASVREIIETKVHKTGQFCCAHDYALVHEDIHAKFCAKFSEALEALGEKRNVCLLGRRQYDSLKRKFEAIEAECIPPMKFPCVMDHARMSFPMSGILDPSLDSEFLSSEIFGPVMPILKVTDVQDAIIRVNQMATGKPLIAYCYSEDPASVDAFIACTSSGNVAVNSGPQRLLANFNVSFGGVGYSGSGASFWGREAMREFTNRKHVICPKKGTFAKSYFSGPPPAAVPP